MKFNATITGWGEDALGFLEMEEMNCIVLFNDDAPEELAEIAVLHSKSEIYAEPEVGDILIICEKAFNVTAVGEEAKHTLRDLGHCTLSFKGGDVPERPGCIMLEGDPIDASDIVEGGKIELY